MVAKKETTGKLGVKLMESIGLYFRKPYVNYLPTIAVALIVHKYSIGLSIF